MRKMVLSAVAFCFGISAFAQNPIVTGDTMLCPEGTGTLSTGAFDTYQWYQRYFMSDDTFEIVGATSQTLNMTYGDFAASYLIVEVTQGTDTAMSAEVFVDGYVFIPPVVATSGDFTIGQNGETILCVGDTVYFELLQPYTESITWFDNGVAIPGEDSSVLVVTDAGSFTVSGAPEVCPDYISMMGIPLDVIMDNCGLGLDEEALFETTIWPNPANDHLTVKTSSVPSNGIEIHDQAGRLIRTIAATAMETEIALSGMAPGTYFLTVSYETGTDRKSFVIR